MLINASGICLETRPEFPVSASFPFFKVGNAETKRGAWIFPVWDAAAAGARTGREVRRFLCDSTDARRSVLAPSLGREREPVPFLSQQKATEPVELACRGAPPEGFR